MLKMFFYELPKLNNSKIRAYICEAVAGCCKTVIKPIDTAWKCVECMFTVQLEIRRVHSLVKHTTVKWTNCEGISERVYL